MQLPRRAVLAGAAALPFLPRPARAAWPARPVTLVVPFAAGGTSDLLARGLAAEMTGLGQPVQVELRPGRNTQVGTGLAARAAADGHTLLLTATAIAINAAVFPDLPFDSRRDFAPVALLARSPLVLTVPAASAVRDVPGLLAAARAGTISFGSPGLGTIQHVGIEMLAARTSIEVRHVPYRGSGEVARDLAAGVIDAAIDSPAALLPRLRDGTLRALAVAAPARLSALPDVPTLAEAGLAGIELINWFGLFAPAATPAPVLDAAASAFAGAVGGAALGARFAAEGVEVAGGTRAAFASLVEAEYPRWAAIVRERNIRPE